MQPSATMQLTWYTHSRDGIRHPRSRKAYTCIATINFAIINTTGTAPPRDGL